MTKTLENNALNSIAARLKYARNISHLDRVAFSQKHCIPESTLRLWESGRGPISQKGLDKCLESLQQEGINVTMEWLKEGKGDLPTHDIALISFIKHSNYSQTPKREYFQEIYSFLSNKVPDCIFYSISNEDMLPTYKPGEFVVGKVIQAPIKDLNLKDCIVHLITGEVLFRKVSVTQQNLINLTPINQFSQTAPIFNAQTKAIAPIFLHYIL